MERREASGKTVRPSSHCDPLVLNREFAQQCRIRKTPHAHDVVDGITAACDVRSRGRAAIGKTHRYNYGTSRMLSRSSSKSAFVFVPAAS